MEGVPIVQAPMAGSSGADLAISVSNAGGLGSLPCAMLRPDQIRAAVTRFRERTPGPINLNFFCHTPPAPDADREAQWKRTLTSYYTEFGIDPSAASPAPVRAPFDDAMCDVVEDLKPEVVSFHFGLPPQSLLTRVKAAAAKVLCSATTVAEAVWLEQHGCDVVIAQGIEAGGHRGMFLTTDIASQVGTMALVPQIVDAVKVPVIAAGGIMDARGIAAALALGAAAVQLGTAYLRCKECATSAVHRRALETVSNGATVLTNIFTGRPARGIVNRLIRELGSMRDHVPAFPRASHALAPLRAHAEARGSGDFSPLWAGQGAAMAKDTDAATLTRELMDEALSLIRKKPKP